ncbi:MAG: hypothetical protein WCL06_14140, partial [Bacteroidota bacterium]
MSQDKLFVIAVGGTGMRCLESFTHLCAIGLFDDQEIEILTLDTDQFNGNKDKSEKLVQLYSRVKTSDGISSPNTDTFFSAKLNLHRFWTNYEGIGRETYRNITKITSGSKEQQEDNKLLSDLFLEQGTVQEFNLSHGYRAQTHLGSLLMYHGIIEAARSLLKGTDVKVEEKELETFLLKLEQAGEGARVFIFGSVFGGTGASSIPVIPKAFKDAIEIRSEGKSSIDLSKVKFGSTLLTEYFSFKKPDRKQTEKKDDRVIADSSYFSLNSQAALQFYQNDPTVQTTYKVLYHIGWPIESKSFDGDKKEEKTNTGGATQKNPCHITELMCACAAYDFFKRKDNFDSQKKAEYVYKAIEFDKSSFNFDFSDFVGNENNAGEIFANRLGAFLSLAHIALTKNGAATRNDLGVKGFINQLSIQKLPLYNSISDEETIEIDEYLKQFAYTFDGAVFIPGWIYQVRNSVSPGRFMFNDKAFASNLGELKNLDIGALFLDAKHHWDKGGITSNRYNTFVDKLIGNGNP